jgi:redox-sensitive bicupin YhaK (pirin superfamily)
LQKDGILEIPISSTFNTLIYVLEGALKSGEHTILTKDMAIFQNDGDLIEVKAMANTRYIVLAGEPINEPVAQYGPFVMNTETQLMEAVRDAQMGKMGVLIESFDATD